MQIETDVGFLTIFDLFGCCNSRKKGVYYTYERSKKVKDKIDLVRKRGVI